MKPFKTLFVLVCLISSVAFSQLIEHRVVWFHPNQFKTPELCDQFVKRMVSARINVAYPLNCSQNFTGDRFSPKTMRHLHPYCLGFPSLLVGW